MNYFRSTQVLIFAMFVVLTGAPDARAMSFDEVMPFPGLDNLRVHVALSAGDTKGEIELTGRIVPAEAKEGAPLWEGSLGKAKLDPKSSAESDHALKNLHPNLWTPATPNLYMLTIDARQNGKSLATKTVRFGFRTFEAKAGHLLLNGKPIFLRGIAINPPGRGVPKEVGESKKFADDYVRFMRAHNVNIIRLEHDSEAWFEACDEQGMMIYQGIYGSPSGGKDIPANKKKLPTVDEAVAHYYTIFDNYVQHPSIVIYVLSNELPYAGKIGEKWHDFLTQVHAKLKPRYTVPFIGNAGYGQGREGDINDVHRYWGWYYNSLLTYFNLRDPLLFGDPVKSKTQPLTFSECVGSFTGPSGAFNLTFRKQLGASLDWTGHAEDQIGEAQEYQAFIFQHAAESFRTMRAINPRLSGLMPFTILFRNWVGIQSFDQMGHNANADQMTASYRPVLLSWEMWTPNVYAGTKLSATAHVVNDSEDFSDLVGATLSYELRDSTGKAVAGIAKTSELETVPYYGTSRTKIDIDLPATLSTGKYTVAGVIKKKKDQFSEGKFDVFIAGSDWKQGGAKAPTGAVRLYDPKGKTAAALKQLGIATQPAEFGHVSPDPIVVGEDAWDEQVNKAFAPSLIKSIIESGQRILILSQKSDRSFTNWLPSKIEYPRTSVNDPTYEKKERPTYDGMHVNPERPWHPVLAGISRDNLKLWSDYTGWDQFKPGFPAIYPVMAGFKLTSASDLAHTAIIANYDRGLEAIAIAEMFDAKGSVVLTGLDLVRRIGKDPVADRMLKNLIAYVSGTDGRDVHPLVDKPIEWGNYPTEKGVVVEPIGGLVVNCRWQRPPTAPDATPLKDNEGAWNTRPGDGFVPHGRRVLGPWTYTNATGIRELNDKGEVASEVPTDAAAPGELDDVDNAIRKVKSSPIGAGEFWARIPPGKQFCITKVENPTDKPGKIEVHVNGGKSESIEVPPGKDAVVKCPVPNSATDVNVHFKADKSLVLLETSFE